ncbi:amino acid permease [Sulfodiicoccus acidiphilus]|nr:APC family permease [Sulfodiicoccus acidiphilus]
MKPFVRETSGLVKRASLLDATMLNVANMGAGLAIFTGVSPYEIKGSVLWLAALFTFLLTVPLLLVYTGLIVSVPRTGGDYVWISRGLNGPLGAILGVALAFNMPPFFALSAFFSVAAVNYFLLTVGSLDKTSSLIWAANHVFVNPYGTLTGYQDVLLYAMAAAAFSVVVAINVLRPSWGFKLTSYLGAFSLAATFAAIAVLAANLGDFHTKIAPFLAAMDLRPQPYVGPTFSLSATLYMVPYFASFAFIWLYAGPAVGSEIRTRRAVKYNLVLGSLLTLVLTALPFLLMDLAGGYGFNYGLYSSDIYNFWTATLALAGNPVLQWFIGLGLIAWNYFVMAFGVVVFARYIFAFSFDRLFPELFSRLNKAGSPAFAHFLDLVVTLVFLAVPIISPVGTQALYSYTPLAVVYLIAVSITGVVWGLKTRRSFLTYAGVASIPLLLGLGYESFTNPYFGVVSASGLNVGGVIYLACLFGLGGIVYMAARVVNGRRGIDLSVTYREIPPE